MIEFPKLGYELHELLDDEDGTGCDLSYNIPCGFKDIFMVAPPLHMHIRKWTSTASFYMDRLRTTM